MSKNIVAILKAAALHHIPNAELERSLNDSVHYAKRNIVGSFGGIVFDDGNGIEYPWLLLDCDDPAERISIPVMASDLERDMPEDIVVGDRISVGVSHQFGGATGAVFKSLEIRHRQIEP
ncbi:MAG: hypothetical protein ACYCSH_01520 [Acidithiobacillus sp.]